MGEMQLLFRELTSPFFLYFHQRGVIISGRGNYSRDSII